MQGQNAMNMKKIFLTLAISALPFSAYLLYGQTGTPQTTDTSSLITKYEAKQQKERDKQRLDDASVAKKQTKADARKTKQVNRDADNASRESKKAYRDEKKAQKARKNSSDQAEKAAQARKKSESN